MCQEPDLHVGYMFASPIQVSDILYDQLNYLEEARTIRNTAEQSKVRLKFLVSVLTKDSLSEMLSRKPRALHFSCHGIEKKMPRNALKSYLLFETFGGDGIEISEEEIKKILNNYNVELDFVFVAACKSEQVGKIFLKRGVKHVICVESGKSVKDEAVLDFTNRFYQMIFQGHPICKAYELARGDVDIKHKKADANMLKMLKDTDTDQHVCSTFKYCLRPGQLQEITDQV